MTYTKFQSIVEAMIGHNDRIRKAYAIKIDLWDAFEDQAKVVDQLWEEVLTVEGVDWLLWYLYEKDGISGKPRKDIKAWDEERKEICKDIKSLWKYLTKSKYFKNQIP